MYGQGNDDGLVLQHDNAAIELSTDATLIIGNSSNMVYSASMLKSSIDEWSKLSNEDNICSLVDLEKTVGLYTIHGPGIVRRIGV